MKLVPSCTARRRTANASFASRGSPQMPSPVMRIAPKPMRLTCKSPPINSVPAAAAGALGSTTTAAAPAEPAALAHGAFTPLAITVPAAATPPRKPRRESTSDMAPTPVNQHANRPGAPAPLSPRLRNLRQPIRAALYPLQPRILRPIVVGYSHRPIPIEILHDQLYRCVRTMRYHESFSQPFRPILASVHGDDHRSRGEPCIVSRPTPKHFRDLP